MPEIPRVLLCCLRDPKDRMAQHEHGCFAEAADLPDDELDVHYMMTGRPTIATLHDYDAVLFGGSGAYSVLDDVPWIHESMEVLLEVIALRKPAWGSCFAFQGLTLALGGEVTRDDDAVEMGSFPLRLTEAGKDDPLFRHLPERFYAQEGHHDRVVRLPDEVTLLATGELCYEQAFKVDGAPFWASQFHPELDKLKTLERFEHYREHYTHGDAEQIRSFLLGQPDSTDLGVLLRKLVRGEF